jgi:YD repeat-containing protein
MTKLIDGNGNATRWIRDIQGRVSEKVYADASSYTYTYDSGGRLETLEDAMGRETTYAYYVDDNVESIDYEDVDTPDVSYTYDPWFDRIASRTDGTGVTSYSYHAYDGSTLGAGCTGPRCSRRVVPESREDMSAVRAPR